MVRVVEGDWIRVGEWQPAEFGLQSVQRSGRPELIAFWTMAGAVAGGGAVLSLLQPDQVTKPNPASGSLIAAGAGAGALSGLLLANALTPEYIQDNLALHRIGHMWIGAAEGALVGLAIERKPVAAWLGGTLGLGVGATAGILWEAAPGTAIGLGFRSSIRHSSPRTCT